MDAGTAALLALDRLAAQAKQDGPADRRPQ